MSSFLEGELLSLEAIDPADLGYYKWFNNQEVCAGNSHCVYPMTYYDVQEYIKGIDQTTLLLAIITRYSKEHIGNISLQDINLINRSADMALIIGYKVAWGKGYGTEACKLIIDHGFNALNLHRITCGTFSTNVEMMRLAEKLGFVQEGVRKQAAWKNGEWVDVVEYGLLNI